MKDWENGRLYLPLDELNAFNLTPDDIANGRRDHRWNAFMRFQIRRARRLYASALPGVSFLGSSGRFAIAAAAELYRAILDDIESADLDVFTRRAHTTTVRKLRMLPGIWWRSAIVGYNHLEALPRDNQVALLATICVPNDQP